LLSVCPPAAAQVRLEEMIAMMLATALLRHRSPLPLLGGLPPLPGHSDDEARLVVILLSLLLLLL
jgi:hypothetical protein